MPGVGSGNARALLLFAVAWRCRGARPDIWRHGIEAPDDVKAAWPAHPPMYAYAPAAAKAPIKPPQPATPPRPPVRLPFPPLWPIAHEPRADAVLGLALNYKVRERSRTFPLSSRDAR